MHVDGELRRLEEDIVLDKKFKHDISVVIDRLIMRPDLRKRLADSVETAVARADGLVDIQDVETGDVATFSEQFACLNCGTSMPELEPRMFSFNSPHGACPRCTGLGSQMEIDPELIVPDPSLSLGEGAILPWSTSASNYYEQMTQAIAEKWEIDMETPWEDLSEEVRDTFLYGTNGDKIYVSYRNRYGRRRSYMTRFEGILNNLERRYRETTPTTPARRSRSTCRCGLALSARARACGPRAARCWSEDSACTSSRPSRCDARLSGSTSWT